MKLCSYLSVNMWNVNAPNFALNVCRLCANISEVVIPIFGKEGEKERIDLKIKKCLPIAVREEDYKPKQVCFTCASKLEVCADLVDLCLASEFKFESVLQARYPGLKQAGTNQPQIQDDPVEAKDADLTVVPLLETTEKSGEHDSSTLTVQHDGGVIVLSKVDGGECQNRTGEECQDILLMVELKYKDVPETQPQHQHGKDQAITPTIAYTVEPQGKTYTLAYSTEHQQIISKSHAITYTAETQPNAVTRHPTFTYNSTPQQASDGNKTHALSYTVDSLALAPSKLHTLVYTTDSQPVALTKGQTLQYSDTGQPVALIKYAAEQEAADRPSEIIDEKASTFPPPDATDPNIVPNNDVTPDGATVFAPPDKLKENGTAPPREKPFHCEVCGKSFMRRTNLNVHMAVHTQIRPHECDQCGKRFVLRWDLTLHQRIHAGLFQCEFCNKAFSVRGKLERHRRTHTGERPYACPTCGKAFGDKRNLESHQRTHSGERPFSCTQCGRSFRVRSHLSDHRRVHSQDTPFTCDTCGKSFKWKTNLNIHLKVHAGERFPCEECGREFGRRADLVKHQRTHTGDRPHVCGICSKSYSDKALLQKHLKSHSDHKPYTCDVCGKSFHFHWYLNTHKKIHLQSEEKNICPICGKVFNKKANLLLHSKTHIDEHL